MIRVTGQDQEARRRLIKDCRTAAVVVAVLMMLVLPCAGAVVESSWVDCAGGSRVLNEACSRDGEGGLNLDLRVGDESLARVRLDPSSIERSAGVIRHFTCEAGRVLSDWIEGSEDGEPRVKGKQNADSGRSP